MMQKEYFLKINGAGQREEGRRGSEMEMVQGRDCSGGQELAQR